MGAKSLFFRAQLEVLGISENLKGPLSRALQNPAPFAPF